MEPSSRSLRVAAFQRRSAVMGRREAVFSGAILARFLAQSLDSLNHTTRLRATPRGCRAALDREVPALQPHARVRMQKHDRRGAHSSIGQSSGLIIYLICCTFLIKVFIISNLRFKNVVKIASTVLLQFCGSRNIKNCRSKVKFSAP